MGNFFGCLKSEEQKTKDLVNLYAKDLINNLRIQMSFLEIRTSLGVEATTAVCFNIENTFHKGTANYKILLSTLNDSLLTLSQFALKNHQKEYMQIYVTNHLALQIRDCILQVAFNKPQFEERRASIYTPPLSAEGTKRRVEIKNIFWNKIDVNHYTPTDVKLLTHTFENLILDTVKKLDPTVMVQITLKDYQAEYAALISREATWQIYADTEAKDRAGRMMIR